MDGPLDTAPRRIEAAPVPARALPAIEAQDYMAAMSRAVTGVSIVTTDGPAGRFGLTVSAVTSVSAEPPLILVCINRRSPAASALRTNGIFCVSLLAAHQDHLSDSFAGRPRNGAPFSFSGADWHETPSGAWRLPDAVASFDCALHAVHEAGSHGLFIGRVIAVATSPHAPLAHCRRAYCIPTPPEVAGRATSPQPFALRKAS